MSKHKKHFRTFISVVFVIGSYISTTAFAQDASSANNRCSEGISPPSEEITFWLSQRKQAFQQLSKTLPILSGANYTEYKKSYNDLLGSINYSLPTPQNFTLKPCTEYYQADFQGLDGYHAIAIESVFNHANFEGAKFRDSFFIEAQMQHANLSRAEFESTNFERANLSNAVMDFSNLSRSNFNNTKLANVKLRHANAYNAEFSDADISHADLTESSFAYSDLTNTNFNSSKLNKAYLGNANATGANFYGSQLKGATLLDTLLISANISSLEGAIIHNTNISYACISRKMDFTKLEIADIGQLVGLEKVLFDLTNDCKSLITKTGAGFEIAPWRGHKANGLVGHNPPPIIQIESPYEKFSSPVGFLQTAKKLYRKGYYDTARKMVYAYRHNEQRFLRYEVRQKLQEGYLLEGISSGAKYSLYVLLDATTHWGMKPSLALQHWLILVVIGFLVFLYESHLRDKMRASTPERAAEFCISRKRSFLTHVGNAALLSFRNALSPLPQPMPPSLQKRWVELFLLTQKRVGVYLIISFLITLFFSPFLSW